MSGFGSENVANVKKKKFENGFKNTFQNTVRDTQDSSEICEKTGRHLHYLLQENNLSDTPNFPGCQKSNQANDLSLSHTKGLQVLTMLSTRSNGGGDSWNIGSNQGKGY